MGKLARKTCLVVSVGHWSGIKDISPSFRSNKTRGTNSSHKAASDQPLLLMTGDGEVRKSQGIFVVEVADLL